MKLDLYFGGIVSVKFKPFFETFIMFPNNFAGETTTTVTYEDLDYRLLDFNGTKKLYFL